METDLSKKPSETIISRECFPIVEPTGKFGGHDQQPRDE